MAQSATAAAVTIPGAQQHNPSWTKGTLIEAYCCDSCRKKLAAGTSVNRGSVGLTINIVACSDECKSGAVRNRSMCQLGGRRAAKFR